MQLYGTISSNSREAGLRVVVGESLSINRVGKLEGRIAGSLIPILSRLCTSRLNNKEWLKSTDRECISRNHSRVGCRPANTSSVFKPEIRLPRDC